MVGIGGEAAVWDDRRIAAASDEQSIRRGVAYAERGAVRLLEATEHRLAASVRGSETYQVTLTPRTWDCTCPVGLEGRFCKHCVATALAARGQIDVSPVPRGPVDLKSLSREVTALRARRYLDWRQATDWAQEKSFVVDDLEASATQPGSVPLLQRAAERLTLTAQQADDSNGSIGDLVLRVLDAHRRACNANPPDPVALAEWLLTFGIDDADWWSFEVDRYADALGPTGIGHYREGLAKRPADSFAVQQAQQRLAILDRDVDRVVRLVGGSLDLPFRYQLLAEALLDMQMPDLALTWARRGLAKTSGHQLAGLYELTLRLDPSDEVALRSEWHQRLPTVSTYAALERAAGLAWPEFEAEARAALPLYQLVDALLHDGDVEAAWTTAMSNAAATFPAQWRRLADAYAMQNPAATLPVYRTLIADTLKTADAQNYREAVGLLRKLRTASRAAGDETYPEYLAELREQQRRRPTMVKLLASAHLD
jgi:hypothetical protein